MKKILFILTCCSFIISQCYAQTLPRRVYLGIRMENLSGDSRRLMGLDSLQGVLVSEVFPGSTAAHAGMKRGDILHTINGSDVHTTQEVLAVLAKQQGGSFFKYTLHRDRKLLKGQSTFRTFPEEQYAGLDVIYTSTKSAVGLQRIIITRPKTKHRLPVVAFIGGIGCYSLDFPTDTLRSEVQLLNTLTRAGYLCARLEKPGQGDNAGHSKACQEISFEEETASYIAAIRTLKARDDVDSNAVYIFGHSMGGLFAPLVAQQTALKGIISYGTIGSNFQEYLVKTRRTIAEAFSMNPEETDDLIKDFCACSGYYFIDKLSTDEAAKKNPRCREYLSVFDLRSRAYNDELYSFNIPGLWKNFTGKALMLWGESDFISSWEDHRIVADAVNYYHPGQATFTTVKDAAHDMTLAASFREARARAGSYNQEVGRVILDWLKKHSS